MLNIYYCGTCKKCLPKENFNQCDLCHDLLQGKCPCCNICDLCYDYELTKCYNYRTGALCNTKNEGLYLTICSKCLVLLNSPSQTRSSKLKIVLKRLTLKQSLKMMDVVCFDKIILYSNHINVKIKR